MKILLVDDNPHALNQLRSAVEKACPNTKIYSFTSPREALAASKTNAPDVAFLDIEMVGLNGIALGKFLKELNPAVRLVFCTGYSEYAMEAIKLHASGYLMKPITAEDIKGEIEAMQKPLFIPYRREVVIRTFGQFEVFSNGKIVDFKRSKAKEALAILVDNNGALVKSESIASLLWGDDVFDTSRQKQLYTIISDMRKALDAVGAYDIVMKGSKGYAIDRSKVDCDFYRLMSGDLAVLNNYEGKYMEGYGWAELSLEKIERMID